MVEMLLENERVDRLRLRQVGEDWIRAITSGALDRLEGLCQPQVASQLLTPKRYLNFENATDLTTKVRQWFGGYSHIQVEDSRVELIGERLGIFYRFLVPEQAGWSRIEQQLFCTMQDGKIAHLHLLCSGFQPVALSGLSALSNGQTEDDKSLDRDELLVFYTGTEANGSTCSMLTPAIKSKLRQMESGQVLEVRVDDPTARGDIEAWCRLSGNSLLKMSQVEGPELSFFVQKK